MFNTKKEIKTKFYNDYSIFNLINPDDNNYFQNMKGQELQELLYYLEKYYLELRSQLNFDPNITFGLEIEFEQLNKNEIIKKIKENNLDNWIIKKEDTFKNGYEINSPILKDNITTWQELKLICSIIDNNGIKTEDCGGHIHIGTQILKDNIETWLNFIKLWSTYENIIYRFGYGEYLSPRKNIQNHAKPLSKTLWEDYQSIIKIKNLNIDKLLLEISHERKQAINFYNIYDFNEIDFKNTIEFRFPNITFNPIIWQNNINLLINLLLYCKNKNFNHELIEKRRSINQNKYTTIEWYSEIYLVQALELSDMIFQKNIDKLYFLRQYLKSFETESKKLKKAKQFTI